MFSKRKKNNFQNKGIFFDNLNYRYDILIGILLLKILSYNFQNTPHFNELELSHFLAFY